MTRREFIHRSAAASILTAMSHSRLIGSSPPPAAVNGVVTGNTAFAFDLYSKLGAAAGNQFFSPYSVSAALAMTSCGAANATLEEMVRVLHLPADQAEAQAGMAALTKQLLDAAASGGYELRIANALWGQSGFAFQREFLAQVKANYGAGFQTVDYRKPEAARQQINRWVEAQTKDKIKDLFQAGTIDADTRLVLANAIYFKGKWANEFKPSATYDAPFFSGTQSAKTPTMHQKSRFGYAEGDDWQLLEMRYKNCSLAMDVILPRAKDGLAELERKFNPAWLTEALGVIKSEEVNVSLPKFKTTIDYNLTDTLSSMGMARAFSRSEADFSRMSTAERLMIGVVVHKAFIDVTEEGTEAAAATGVEMTLAAAPVQKPPKVFNADHPFFFAIRDTATGSLLFSGRLAKI